MDEPDDLARDAPGKGPDAFRTISEVAQELGLPQHVLRFWESRFSQIKPIKRGGGRRYYRPGDVELLRGVKQLLYGEGYTIRGVQRILREQGGRKIASAAGAGARVEPHEPVGEAFRAEPLRPASVAAGPELWAPPARRSQPAAETNVSDDPTAPLPPYAEHLRAAAPPPASEPQIPSRRGLSEDQAGRLALALTELKACRGLLEKRR